MIIIKMLGKTDLPVISLSKFPNWKRVFDMQIYRHYYQIKWGLLLFCYRTLKGIALFPNIELSLLTVDIRNLRRSHTTARMHQFNEIVKGLDVFHTVSFVIKSSHAASAGGIIKHNVILHEHRYKLDLVWNHYGSN